MKQNSISLENFKLLQNNIDELINQFNDIILRKGLPFELQEVRFRETTNFDQKVKDRAALALPDIENHELQEFVRKFRYVDETIAFQREIHCPRGIDHYDCSPTTGVCIPVCK